MPKKMLPTRQQGDVPSALADLPNLGPKSVQFLRGAGIISRAQLEGLGAVNAYFKVKQIERRASLNLLWALEGAITGLHWRDVAREHRTSLLLALETLERSHSGMPKK